MLCPLCPLCCIQGSKTQGYALTWFSHFGYQSIWSKADNLQSTLRGSWGHRNCKTDRGRGPHQKDMPWKISSLFLNLTSDTSLCCLCPTARSMWNGRTLRLAGENSWVDIDVTLLDSLEISHIAWDIYIAPVHVSMYQNLSAIVVTSIGFQNLPWHREVVTLPNERLDSQHDEGQFSECYLGAAKGNLVQRCFHNFGHVLNQPNTTTLFVSVRYSPTQRSLARDFST